MKLDFKEYTTKSGEILLYLGNPNLNILEKVSMEFGDIWHSSLDQGYKNSFPEIKYQMPTYWYVNDFENLNQALNWRINPNLFAVRKSVWDFFDGFDNNFQTNQMMALDFGYKAVNYRGIIPLYIQNLYPKVIENFTIPLVDKYAFYVKNFKINHANYLLFRIGLFNPSHWTALNKAKKKFTYQPVNKIFPAKKLKEIQGKPTVSYIIPTMLRQEFTVTLLKDLSNQSYPVSQVIVVDATPNDKRNIELYNFTDYSFEVILKWQETKGSCRARNEAIDLSTGDYIIFGDDDVRLPQDFVENHIRVLQTYNAVACNGLDVQADNMHQDLNDLKNKLDKIDFYKHRVGATSTFSNANSCVRRDYIEKLVGNDINYDGGYGEDSDFGISLYKLGTVVLFNSFSANLHLKPPVGGYRFWGIQAKVKGKNRKKQPWELDTPVKNTVPVPSPTITYQVLKHFNAEQLKEFKFKYLLRFVTKGSVFTIPFRLLQLPEKNKKFQKSIFYAKKLVALGKRTK